MKKYLISAVLLASLTFFSCNKDTNDIVSEKPVIENEIIQSRPEEFKNLPIEPIELVKYVENNIKNYSDKDKEKLLNVLEDTLSIHLSFMGDIINTPDVIQELSQFTDKDILFSEDIEKISDTSIKNELKKITDSYYIISKRNGEYLPNIDYSKLKDFTKDMNTALNQYYEIKIDETLNPTVVKAKINIPIKEYIERLNKTEEFIKNNPDFSRIQEMINVYKYSLFLLFTGTSLSPSVTADGFSKNYMDYLEAEKEFNTSTEKSFIKAMEMIEDNKYIIDDKMYDVLRNIAIDTAITFIN